MSCLIAGRGAEYETKTPTKKTIWYLRIKPLVFQELLFIFIKLTHFLDINIVRISYENEFSIRFIRRRSRFSLSLSLAYCFVGFALLHDLHKFPSLSQHSC
jgi:hypothetical protein